MYRQANMAKLFAEQKDGLNQSLLTSCNNSRKECVYILTYSVGMNTATDINKCDWRLKKQDDTFFI